jgi:hypothetical protein
MGPYRLCDPNVLAMKTADPRHWFDTAHCLHRSVERSILVERKVRASPTVVGAIFCQQIAQRCAAI